MPTRKKTLGLDIQALANELRPSLRKAAQGMWEAGDILTAKQEPTPGEWQELSEVLGVEQATLQNYRRVATIFPAHRRPVNYLDMPFGVFKQLARYEFRDKDTNKMDGQRTEVWQDKFLANNPTASVNKTEKAVGAQLKIDRPGPAIPSQVKVRDEMEVGGITVSLTVRSNGRGDLVVTGISKADLSEFDGDFTIKFAK